MIEQRFIELIATDVNVKPEQVEAAVGYLDKGASIPFLARYRKDATGGLSENKLERIAERNDYYVALTSRRNAILENIEKQNSLTDDIRALFMACDDHLRLEDLSLPFKKQRNNRAAIAANKGLLPLADYIWAQSPTSPPPEMYAVSFVNPEKQVLSEEEALEGARHILAECIAMNAEIRKEIRNRLLDEGRLVVTPAKLQPDKAARYASFVDYAERLSAIPDDKLLLILRGERDAALRVELTLDDEQIMDAIAQRFTREQASAYEQEIRAAVADAYKRLLRPAIEAEVFALVRRRADEAMVLVCREQARHLLQMPPVGPRPLMGMCVWTPQQRAVAVIDESGRPAAHTVIESKDPAELDEKTRDVFMELIGAHHVEGVGVGCGAGGRELLRCVQDILRQNNERRLFATLVQDIGLNTYVHSNLAAAELADMDVPARAAVSLARRLQDPLLELVKVDPVYLVSGRYAAGVNRKRLQAGIVRTIESVVNRVGVDANTAPVELLRYVSGLQVGVAQAIIEERNKREGFTNRTQLLEVAGIGEKTYQQCVGFLRIHNGENPLDASAIHPEAYPVLERIATSLETSIDDMVKAPETVRDLNMETFAEDAVGLMMLEDIRYELGRIGRDPRRRFRAPANFMPLESMDDLTPGLVIEGIITNVTDFGVFVNIGLPQEGLVHRSEVGRAILNDPKRTLQVGEVVKVSVLQVEKESEKISLSIKGAAKLPLTRPDRRRPGDRDTGPGREERRGLAWGQDNGGRGGRRDTGRMGESQFGRPQRRKGKGMALPKVAARSESRKKEGEPLNTSLAEQLAALRDKIVSEGK